MTILSTLLEAALIINTASAATEPTAQAADLSGILRRPLIVGASVSNDHLTGSPGKRLALRYTTPNRIRKITRSGTSGSTIMKLVNEKDVQDRTAIIALDLFFWDSVRGSPATAESAIRKLTDLAKKYDVNLVVGEVPEFSNRHQPYAKIINQKIRSHCKSTNGCRILPLNKMLKKLLADRSIEHRGVRYPVESLLPDGLHISEPASDYLADRIEELF